jgi:hypothetical protein
MQHIASVHEILRLQTNAAAPIERSMRTFVPVQGWLIADRFDVENCPSPEGGLIMCTGGA